MILAHLPAGYLFSRWLGQQLPGKLQSNWLLPCGLLGSILPDLDLLYFYLLDARQHHHHTYWPHLPVFWLPVTVIALNALWHRRNDQTFGCALAMLANIWLHLLLDSWAGDIWWLYPWLDKPFALVQVPPAEGFWLWAFVGHWSFLAEIALLLAAARAWRDANQRRTAASRLTPADRRARYPRPARHR